MIPPSYADQYKHYWLTLAGRAMHDFGLIYWDSEESTADVAVEEIDHFVARGMRRVFRRSGHFARNRIFNMDIWRDNDSSNRAFSHLGIYFDYEIVMGTGCRITFWTAEYNSVSISGVLIETIKEYRAPLFHLSCLGFSRHQPITGKTAI